MSSEKDDEFGYFILGVIITCAMWVIFFSLANKHIPNPHLQMATNVCENNEGIEYIEYNMINHSKAHCINGAVFKIKGE